MTKPPTERKKPRERRAESRHSISEAGVIKSTHAGIAVAQVLDTSESGIRVTTPFPLPANTEVQVVFGDLEICGSVRNCVRAQGSQFHVGIGNLRSAPQESSENLAKYAELDRLPDVLRSAAAHRSLK